jgi:hypothetical protein
MKYMAYLAIKSILGKKKWIKTTKEHIIARMFGFNTYQDLKIEINQYPILKSLEEKYSRRRQMDKIFDELQVSNLVSNIIGFKGRRGLYINLSLSDKEFGEILALKLYKKDERKRRNNILKEKINEQFK